VFLRALGLESDELILKKFYSAVKLSFEKGKARLVLPPDVLARKSSVSSTSAASQGRPHLRRRQS